MYVGETTFICSVMIALMCVQMFVLISVGYMMDTMYFSALDHPIQVDSDIASTNGMPLVETNTVDCSQNYTSGAPSS